LNMDETGMVVSIEGDKVTFVSDLTETEVRCSFYYQAIL
jgi:transcription elongation factor